jgi:hypothetical protein
MAARQVADAIPTIFLQWGQQKTRFRAYQPRLTSISFSTSSSQNGQIGTISSLSIFIRTPVESWRLRAKHISQEPLR